MNELDLVSMCYRDFAASKPSLDASASFSFLDECLLEGLLSRTWQAWCNFSRKCLMKSCLGTVTHGGKTIPPLPEAQSAEHVSSAAIRAARKGKPPYWGPPNELLRREPTWGDVDVFVHVATCLAPGNSDQMRAAFSTGHRRAKALQSIRNGAAHLNAQTLVEILGIRSAYIVFQIKHPTHALFWIESSSKDFLITHAIQELKDVGFAAIA